MNAVFSFRVGKFSLSDNYACNSTQSTAPVKTHLGVADTHSFFFPSRFMVQSRYTVTVTLLTGSNSIYSNNVF